MLLEFRSNTQLIKQNFPERLMEALNNVAQVKVFSKEITFECHDIDEITIAVDISAALTFQHPELGNVSLNVIKSIRPMRDGTLRMYESTVNKLLEAGFLRIRWVRSRVRRRTYPTWCTRCLEFGYIKTM